MEKMSYQKPELFELDYRQLATGMSCVTPTAASDEDECSAIDLTAEYEE